MVRGEGERVKVGGERGKVNCEGKECEANTNSSIKG